MSGIVGLPEHQYHLARPDAPLPDQTGIQWIWAGNGVFKRGATAALEIMLLVAPTPPTPGLAHLVAGARWMHWAGRIPGMLLSPLLADAQRAADTSGAIARPIEKQYFIHQQAGRLSLRPARAQQATSHRVRYAMPTGTDVLMDIHSHHGMAAFFSSTDDADDTGLGVSVVIGRIFDAPEIICRLNVYGQHQRVPALTLFDGLGPFRDCYGGADADLDA